MLESKDDKIKVEKITQTKDEVSETTNKKDVTPKKTTVYSIFFICLAEYMAMKKIKIISIISSVLVFMPNFLIPTAYLLS